MVRELGEYLEPFTDGTRLVLPRCLGKVATRRVQEAVQSEHYGDADIALSEAIDAATLGNAACLRDEYIDRAIVRALLGSLPDARADLDRASAVAPGSESVTRAHEDDRRHRPRRGGTSDSTLAVRLSLHRQDTGVSARDDCTERRRGQIASGGQHLNCGGADHT